MTPTRILPTSALVTAALAGAVLVAGCSATAPEAGRSSAGASSTPQSASPTPSASPLITTPPSPPASIPIVAPSLRSLHIDGPGYEQNVTAEEAQARDTIYHALPILLNEASSRYSSPSGARDELATQGLITAHMASTFAPEFTPDQKAVNAAGFTVQTTGMLCSLRTGAGSALQNGKIFCYFSRQYIGPDGSPVNDARWTTTGNPGAINPNELQNAVVTMVKEAGAWKVDGVQFGA